MDHTHTHPPGTLVLYEESTGRGETILSPQPTSSPNDPLNWSTWRKAWHTVLLVCLTGLAAAMANVVGAAQYSMQLELGISDNVFNDAVALIFIGIGAGVFFLSPSPRLLGRRFAYIVCMCSGLIGSAIYGNIRHGGTLIASQFFLGLTDACAEAMVQNSLSDIFFAHQRGSVMGLYVLAISGGTFLGPLVAGYVVNSEALNWPWIGWFGIIFCGVALLLVLFTLEETTFDRTAVLEQQLPRPVVQQDTPPASEKTSATADKPRTESDSQTEADPNEDRALSEGKKSYAQRFAPVTLATTDLEKLVHEYLRLLRLTPRCFVWPAVLFAGLQWSGQVVYLTFYLYVEDVNYYEEPYYYTNAAVALMNVPNLVGLVVGVLYGGVLADKFVEWMARRNGGVAEPEHRLWLMIPSAVVGPAGLLLFGIGTDRGWGYPLTYVGLGFIGFNWGCAGDICLTYMQQSYPGAILECMVGMAVINNVVGMAVTFASGAWIDSQSLTALFSTLAGICFVLAVATVPMIYWGKRMRRMTAAAYLEFVQGVGYP